MTKPLTLCALFLLSAGCGGSPSDAPSSGGMDSQEAAAEALLNAMVKKDVQAVSALFPSEATINALFACENGKLPTKFIEEINQEKSAAMKNEGRRKGPSRRNDLQIHWV